jgi:hypothetical protein
MNDWSFRRSRLVHDRLKNRFELDLEKWLQVIRGSVVDLLFDPARVLSEWRELSKELDVLTATFEAEMSPATLFKDKPISRCYWFVDGISQLWLLKTNSAVLIQESQGALTIADRAFAALHAEHTQGGDASQDVLEEFQNAVRRVRLAIEALPKSVRFT